MVFTIAVTNYSSLILKHHFCWNCKSTFAISSVCLHSAGLFTPFRWV